MLSARQIPLHRMPRSPPRQFPPAARPAGTRVQSQPRSYGDFCADRPIARYGRIFSSRAFETPLIARRSSIFRKGPLFWRTFTIAFAVLGPIPGTCWSCSAVAVFRSIGCAGGFFVSARAPDAAKIISKIERPRSARLIRIILFMTPESVTAHNSLESKLTNHAYHTRLPCASY
jgi:hypothetical protein